MDTQEKNKHPTFNVLVVGGAILSKLDFSDIGDFQIALNQLPRIVDISPTIANEIDIEACSSQAKHVDKAINCILLWCIRSV